MAFPNPERVVYENNPIEEVICQLRFPIILKIDANPVVDFQERIRHQYPLYEEEKPQILGIPGDIAKLLAGGGVEIAGSKPARRFISADRNWTVSLARDFMAVSTKSYSRWEVFEGHLQRATDALESLYEPIFYSRVGLRYRNRIRRSSLRLEGISWSDLLKPQIAAELSSDIAASVVDAKHVLAVRLDRGQVTIRHGLTDVGDEEETTYSIDNDFFVETQTERANVRDIVRDFNQQARNTFRWCITDRLHEAMVPRPMARAG